MSDNYIAFLRLLSTQCSKCLLAVSVIYFFHFGENIQYSLHCFFRKLFQISHCNMTVSFKAHNRDFCRCNFIFAINVLHMFKAPVRVTGWPLRSHNRLRWLDGGLAKSAASPLEEVEGLNQNNETARSDAVLPRSHLHCPIPLNTP